jgi:hypothetical protein
VIVHRGAPAVSFSIEVTKALGARQREMSMDTEGLIILAMVLAILGGLLLGVKLNRILGQLKNTNETLASILEEVRK